MAKKRKNKYNHYTEDFRREAVRRSEDPNTSAVEVARVNRQIVVEQACGKVSVSEPHASGA